MFVYVGTYAKPDTEGIFGYRLNEETGELTQVLRVKAGPNPSYLAITSDRKYLYAVNEVTEHEGQKSGAVSAFAIDPTTGNLTFLNRQPSLGGAPCYISLDEKNQMALVANYVGGNVTALPLQEDGKLKSATDMDQHVGKGPKPQQEAAHAHCILPAPGNQFVVAVDLGIDQIISYKLNASAGGTLERQPQPAFQAKAGAGPRHLTFHPNKRFAYVMNELDGTISALRFQQDKGSFTEIETVSAIPKGYTGQVSGADIHVSPDGRFAYASNRGHNSIGVFKIEEESGKLTLVQHMSTHGDWPRNFTLTPSGKLMVVANQRSNNITTYHVNRQTGHLTYTGKSIELSSPVYLQVVKNFTPTSK
ncbi:6-phosphogluconolactonase [Nibribacter koreensis]|uniref:6-phosphogluconolactonase n=2 Tax=Nibribacter koreensis TaxID=1084519 RepID=A0ABP8FYP9_9BACT